MAEQTEDAWQKRLQSLIEKLEKIAADMRSENSIFKLMRSQESIVEPVLSNIVNIVKVHNPDKAREILREKQDILPYSGYDLPSIANKLEIIATMARECLETDSPIHDVEQEDFVDEPVTLLEFMERYCEQQSENVLRSRRHSLYQAHKNSKKNLTLPEHVGEWDSGQSKKFNAEELKQRWPEYRTELPNLPPLKS